MERCCSTFSERVIYKNKRLLEFMIAIKMNENLYQLKTTIAQELRMQFKKTMK